MGWNDEEVENTKKGMSLSSKILLVIIVCIILIIVLIFMLLMNMQGTAYKIYIDGVANDIVTKETLLATIDNVTYVDIEQFSKLVGYEYHKGEYKASTIEYNKCYVQGQKETASFYLNENTIYKLPVDNLEEEYEEYTLDNETKSINERFYAPLEAISKAFNVILQETDNYFQIYTLDYLVETYNNSVIEWGYTGILEQSFENQKSLLYGYLIVKKEGGLYKIIDTSNTKEFVLDRYTSINFSENMQKFIVTNSSGKVGIINSDGTTNIEPTYESIIVLDKQNSLYLVELNKKYGVVKDNNITVIYPEFDSVGIENSANTSRNKRLILDTLIPVCKDKKYGAYDKKGNLVFEVEYDGFGYNLSSIEIDGIKEIVEPVLAIDRCDGVIVKKSDKYGLISLTGKELVPIAVDGIYAINGIKDEDSRYFMLYNGEELNVIQRLIKAGLIEENVINNTEENIENEIYTNTVNNQLEY